MEPITRQMRKLEAKEKKPLSLSPEARFAMFAQMCSVLVIALFVAALAFAPIVHRGRNRQRNNALTISPQPSAETTPTSSPASNTSTARPSYIYLDVPSLFQEPELPAGCESVALTNVLLYHDFDVSLTDLATEWIPTSDWDYIDAFLGSPFDESGFACMAPGITAASNDYLRDQNSTLAATDLTGAALDELFSYLAAGKPLVVWATVDMDDPGYLYETQYAYDRVYPLYQQTHCLTLTGYDLSKNLVFVSDPLNGAVAYDLDLFKLRYEQLGKQAIAIQ